MRTLWPIEQEILALAAIHYPASAAVLRQQISTARVAKYENSGAGFFSNLVVGDTPPSDEKSPLNAAYGTVAGIEHGMGFLVFLENGRVSMIEGYCNAGETTTAIDFSQVSFELTPSANDESSVV